MIAYWNAGRSPDRGSIPTILTSQMKEFADADGARWIATAEEDLGTDYKGRHHMVLTPAEGGPSVTLEDVRWNSERTARRSIETMSVVELRRRLRAAGGRQAAQRVG